MDDNHKTKRSFNHDYRQPCIYMITVVVDGRRPILGRLAGSVETAHIELTPLGEDVRHELYALCDRYPQLKLLQYQVMPDHVHVIIQATETLAKPLGSLLSSWKIACGRAYARYGGASAAPQDKAATTEEAKAGPGALSGGQALAPAYQRLFSEGYNDSILCGHGQLQHMIDYIRDNPHRLMLKRQQNPYFSIKRGISVAGHRLDAVGNTKLLQNRLFAVHCRRHWNESQHRDYAAQCLAAANNGTVLIGAFISEHEKNIASKIQELRLPLIQIVENGFDDLYKPTGQAFYACAEGRLLQLSLWPYHRDRRTVSREQCNAMNTLAETIATIKP